MTALCCTLTLSRPSGDLRVTVEGRHSGGCPAVGPSYASGGEPADAGDIDLESVTDEATGLEVTDLSGREEERCIEALWEELS